MVPRLAENVGDVENHSRGASTRRIVAEMVEITRESNERRLRYTGYSSVPCAGGVLRCVVERPAGPMSSPQDVTSNATERGAGASPLRLRLRRETAGLHQGLDARLALLTPDLSIDRYRCVLQIFYGFYAPIEAGLLRLADVAPSLGLPLRARAELLGDDLLTL